ncbi:hypothetical protein EOL99_03800 [Candidatus Falkowbacteria bacterium]|jgi:hypothetical protein|nr:hypothetical protein [Candidatus Falkowbacteria bacterium]
MKTIKWFARVVSLLILVFALPFYFGYGNPLPFANPDYSLWENIALLIMPLIFISLALGWKYPKVAGWLIVALTTIVFIVGFLTSANLSINLAAPIIPGILYLINGYKNNKKIYE